MKNLKKLFLLMLFVCFSSFLYGCQLMVDNDFQKAKNEKILVAYYSWGGNTKKVAEMIVNYTGADSFEIIPEQEYSKDYNITLSQAKEEIPNNFEPKLKENISIDDYDIIFIGSPNWLSTMAPPVKTFINSHDFTNKKVIPFVTHGGGGVANVASDICKEAKVEENKNVLVFLGNKAKEDAVKRFLQENNIVIK